MSHTELLFSILDWSLYHGKGEMIHSVLDTLRQENNKVDLNNTVGRRLNFYSMLTAISNCQWIDIASFQSLLNNFDDIEKFKSLAKNTKEFKWINMRRKIIYQMGIAILHNSLNLLNGPLEDNLLNESIFDVPHNFSIKLYKEEINNLFNSNIINNNNNDDKNEKMWIKKSISSLTDICEDNTAKSISKESISLIFQDNEISTFTRELNVFIQSIQNQVLPLPTLEELDRSKTFETNALKFFENIHEADWDVDRLHKDGPYSISNGVLLNNEDSDDNAEFDDDNMIQDAIEGGGSESIESSVYTRKSARRFINEDIETDDEESQVEEAPSSQRKNARVSELKREKNNVTNKGSLIDTRKSAERVEFTQDDDEDDITEDSQLFENATSIKSKFQKIDVPKAKKFASSLKEKSPVPNNNNSNNNTFGRTAWTLDEEGAFIAGVKKHGKGNWSSILDDREFSSTLSKRTNINLKDKYRNMEKKGLF